MSETETTKKPSKKELKKLAKKAEKALAKESHNKKSKDAETANKETTVDAKERVRSYVIKCGGADENDLWRIACTVASLTNVVAERSEEKALFAVPALKHDPSVFGANAVCQRMANDANERSELETDRLKIDEWLEIDRNQLSSERLEDRQLALDTVETELTGNVKGNKSYLLGSSLTVADICVVATLRGLLKSENPPALSPVVKAYHDHHVNSAIFQKASSSPLLKAPAPRVPFDFDKEPSMSRAVQHVLLGAVRSAFPQVDVSVLPPMSKMVTVPNNTDHGDYQCSIAMPLFQKLKKQKGALPPDVKNAKDVADAVVRNVPNDDVLRDLVVNGPGFVLAKVSPDYLAVRVNRLVKTGKPAPPAVLRKEKVVVDFSSPNIAKEMHVGHLRSTIIGESVCRILEHVGHDVDRINHVGDWGTQFGMLIQYLKEESQGEGTEKAEAGITDLTKFYKKAKERFDESPEFKKTSQTNVVLLQSGDPECRRIWNVICEVSRKEFQKIYDRLGVTVEEKGESFYNERIPPVVDAFDKAGLLKIQEGGAKCVFVPKFKIPLMLQKSDGGYGYDSTDMAALEYRLLHVKANRIVYVTDFSQGDHFQMCFAAARAIGWADDSKNVNLQHIGFGTVQGEDGKRFKTRSGDTVRLVDLLEEAVTRSAEDLKRRIEEKKANITADQIPRVAAVLGHGAVKYFDLRRNPTTNYKFSYDAMLDTKGNTAIYLLYAHARLESIISKAKDEHGRDVDELTKNNKDGASIVLGHPAETKLARNLNAFADTVEAALEDMYPYHVCNFLYNTAIAASEFVTQCRVLGSDEMDSRLLLCRATTVVMRQCFDLLGMEYVMRI